MAAAPIDLSAGLVPNSGAVDISAGLVPKSGSPPAEQKGFFSSFADASGLSTLGHAIAHPIDTAMGIPGAIKDEAKRSYGELKTAWNAPTPQSAHDGGQIVDHTLYAAPFVGASLKKADDQAAAGNYKGAAGTGVGVITGLALPGVLKEAAPVAAGAAGDALEATGEASQNLGKKVINQTIGAYKKDFNRGANPGRGYLNTGQGVSASMDSIASKAADAKADVGKQIGGVISNSSLGNQKLFPVQQVIDAISPSLKEAYEAETGPGGLGNTDAFTKYAQGFKDTIQNGIKNGGFTPQEVFDLKQQVGRKAKWSNQTPEGILDVRQQQVGALGGLLTDKFPELKDLNRDYQDLTVLQDRAQWRADSGTPAFGKLVREGAKAASGIGAAAHGGTLEGLAAYGAMSLADSVPGRTAAASALNYGGKGLTALGEKINSLADNSGSASVPATASPQVNQTAVKPVQGQAVPPVSALNTTTISGTTSRGLAQAQRMGASFDRLPERMKRQILTK